MILNRRWIFFALCTLLPILNAAEDYDAMNLDAIISFCELNYQDGCDNVAETEWRLINDPSDHDLQIAWEEARTNFAAIKKKEINTVHSQDYSLSDDDLLNYKLSVLETPGDDLLNETDIRKVCK